MLWLLNLSCWIRLVIVKIVKSGWYIIYIYIYLILFDVVLTEAFCQELPGVLLHALGNGHPRYVWPPVGTAPRWRSGLHVFEDICWVVPLTSNSHKWRVSFFDSRILKNEIILEKGDCYCGGGGSSKIFVWISSQTNNFFKHGTSEIDFGWPRSWGTTPVMAVHGRLVTTPSH